MRYVTGILTSPWLWIATGLVFVVLNLMDPAQARSPVWFVVLFLYMLMINLLWIGRDKPPSQRPKSASVYVSKAEAPPDRAEMRFAGLAYFGLVLVCGAVFEASLSVEGGIGGMHADTLSSFILAFGDYSLLALASLLLIRLLRLDFRQGFFLAGGMALSEGLIFKPVLVSVVLSEQFYLAPILVAFYTLAYASFLALPQLILPYGALWKDDQRPGWVSVPLLWLLGLLAAFVTRLLWGLIYVPNVAAWFGIGFDTA